MGLTDDEIRALLARPADATFRDVEALAQALLDARATAARMFCVAARKGDWARGVGEARRQLQADFHRLERERDDLLLEAHVDTAALRQERDAARAALTAWQIEAGALSDSRDRETARLMDAEARAERLAAAGDLLNGYAQHVAVCATRIPLPSMRCTCGLATARAAWQAALGAEEAPPASTSWQEVDHGIYERTDVEHQIQVAREFGDQVKRADGEQP